jgi:hypothetical protein
MSRDGSDSEEEEEREALLQTRERGARTPRGERSTERLFISLYRYELYDHHNVSCEHGIVRVYSALSTSTSTIISLCIHNLCTSNM